mgnify:CR=1 FL=1
MAFTGTPVSSEDRDTRAVFGDYIHVYDMQQAKEDGATVAIYFESRLARLGLKETDLPQLDEAVDQLAEDEEESQQARLKSRWAALERVVGAEPRVARVAADLVAHFEERQHAQRGKAMVVAMSREICVHLYDAIVALRPGWHDPDPEKGAIKVIMTGSASDKALLKPHITSKDVKKRLERRYKDPADPFKLVIVRDMWLTGFDAPCMHTMYIDKPMQGHGLMQAIARVNRVFLDKPGGLVVDYLGLADQLKKALHTYTESGGQGETALDQEEAVALMLERYEQCSDIFHGFDWSAWTSSSPAARLSVLPAAQEHVLSQESGKERLLQVVTELSKAFALAVPHDEAIRIRDDVGFFQAVRTATAKTQVGDRKGSGDIDHAIRQIVSKAIVSDQVIDIFAAAGLKSA